MRFLIQWIRRQGWNSRLRFSAALRRHRRSRPRPLVEGLESRCLLSVTINEFPIPTSPAQPFRITAGPDGNLWFTETIGSQIGKINPTTHAIAEFPIPTAKSSPAGITTGPDGNLWFTELGVDQIGEINPTTHVITEFPVLTANSEPNEITTGPDGNLWFTETVGNKIGQINPTTHVISEFTVPTFGSEPVGITAGPDGNLWFTEELGNQIAQINPTTHAIAEFPVPSRNSSPSVIMTGPDGNLWFTEPGANKIGQINPTTHTITEFPVPTGGSTPLEIAVGPDGDLWFTEFATSQIGQINPTSHAITDLPTPTANSRPFGITAGPDGNLWFAEQAGNKIGQVQLTAIPTAPDLALSGHAPDSATLASNVTYTLTVTNDGTAGAAGVTLNDTLPAGVTFVSATGGVIPVNGVLTFAIGNLAAGANVGFTIVVTPTAAGTLNDQASVGMNQADPTPADNSVTLTTVVASVATSPDLALSGNAPNLAILGSNVTYTLTVTNDGTAGATGVTLTDTLPLGVTFVSATGGVTPIDGALAFTVGNLAASANVSFTIVVTPTAAGTLHDEGSVSMNQADSTPADNSVTTITTVVTPARADGPTVTKVQRFGFHEQPTTLILTFDEPLDPGRAQNVDDYQIAALDCFPRTIHIKEAVYDAATETITLEPVQRLNLHHRYRLTVVGTGPSGITDTFGNLLDGRETGDPGSDFVAIVTARDLVLTPIDPGKHGSPSRDRSLPR